MAFLVYVPLLGKQYGPYCATCIEVVQDVNDHLELEVDEETAEMFEGCERCGKSLRG